LKEFEFLQFSCVLFLYFVRGLRGYFGRGQARVNHFSQIIIPESFFSLFALWCFLLKFSRPIASLRPLHKNCVPAWTVFCGFTQEDVRNHNQFGPTVITVTERLGVWPTEELSHQHAELEAELNERLATLSALAEAPVRRPSRFFDRTKSTHPEN